MNPITDENNNKLYGFSQIDLEKNTTAIRELVRWTKRFFFAVLIFGSIALCVLIYFIIKYPIFAQLVNSLLER